MPHGGTRHTAFSTTSTAIHNICFDTRVALGTGVDVTDLAVLKNAPDARTIPSADFSVPFNR